MHFYPYIIGEVTLSLLPYYKENIGKHPLPEGCKKALNPFFLCPSLLCDGEIVFSESTPYLLPEALCVSAYHLTVVRGLPLHEYTFLFEKEKYIVKVSKENIVECNIRKCKQLYSKYDISDGKLSLYVDIYDGLCPVVLVKTDVLANARADAFYPLLCKDTKTRGLPFCIWQAEGDDLTFSPFSHLATPLTKSLYFYILPSLSFAKNGDVTSLPFATLHFSHQSVCVKVSPKRAAPLD
ncbi:MAG: hypothetical protein IKC72_07515 [Clostridia bacterium]|nr:hypothetical protein [Clostridia bacterium]